MRALLIRGDAGPEVGAGHVMRCLALGQAWRDTGGAAALVSAGLPAAIASRFAADGIAVRPLAAMPGSDADAEATVEAARAIGARWIVSDSYRFDDAYERALRAHGHQLLAIDDDGTSPHATATRVLNQNLHARAEWYGAAQPPLIGPRYALLRREFADAAAVARPAGAASRCVVTLGGGRWPAALRSILDGLARSEVRDLAFDIVADVADDDVPAIEAALALLPQATWRRTCGNMARILGSSDVAISAAGSTALELACLGVPALLVTLAPNQQPVAGHFAAAGLATNLGPAGALQPDAVAAELERLVLDKGARAQMRAAGRALVDGQGAARVVQVLDDAAVRLRRAVEADARLLWEWANEPSTRAVSFSTAEIPWDVHVDWLRRRLADPGVSLWIAVDRSDQAVGQVRFEPAGDGRVVSVSTSPACRGRGLGTAIIRAGTRRMASRIAGPVIAYIRPDNAASLAAFVKAGYRRTGTEQVHGHEAVRLEFDRSDL